MTRNRESVILTRAADNLSEISTALAMLPADSYPMVHEALNRAMHSTIIIAEEIRQEWAEYSNARRAIE